MQSGVFPSSGVGQDSTAPPEENGYALVLSGGGVRATAFHLGLLLRLAAEGRLEHVKAISTVSGGSLAAGLVFSRAGLEWPSSRNFIDSVLPQASSALVKLSLQGRAVSRTLTRPWKLVTSRGNLLAEALEDAWGIAGNPKELSHCPQWFVNATCYETGRNWRFSQKHLGDWKFGHNFKQVVPIAVAVAASAAIPYMAGFVQLKTQNEGWFSIDPATDQPVRPIAPMLASVRLWDGGVYENLGMEPIYKPYRGLVNKSIQFIIIGDASANLLDHLGPAGMFTLKYPFIRPPRLFDITTEQTRALRSRMLIEAMLEGRLRGAIVRLGRSVDYVDGQSRRMRPRSGKDSFLGEDAVLRAATYPTNASRMTVTDFHLLLRHGFESADATITGFLPSEFQNSMSWQDIKTYCRNLPN